MKTNSYKSTVHKETRSYGRIPLSRSVTSLPSTQKPEAALEVFSFLELCTLLQKKKSTMYALVAAGQAPRGFHVGRELRFRKSVVLAWIEEQELDEYESRAS